MTHIEYKSTTELISNQLRFVCFKRTGDEWEIPFEALRDLEYLASGAQGSVFKCWMGNEVVAAKRVKDKRETDIRHLRALHHPNIIKFK